MQINIPLLNQQTPQTVLKMINLEASQLSLPDSRELMWGAFGAYGVLQAIAQSFNHSLLGSLIYGVMSVVLLYGGTYGLLRVLKEDAKFQRTATALAIMSGLAALIYTDPAPPLRHRPAAALADRKAAALSALSDSDLDGVHVRLPVPARVAAPGAGLLRGGAVRHRHRSDPVAD